MGYVAARCPNCGGDLQLDDKMEKGYCTHCGTPIFFREAIQKIKIVGPVEIAGFAKLDSLVKLIKKDLEYGMNQTPEFRDRLNRALELDPGNQYLYDLQSSEIWNAKIVDGRLMEYKGNVKRVVVPDCVNIIERFAFRTCHILEEIVMPRTITLISEGSFYKEDRLVISAYKNTYAARYALVSPAYLHIIDDDEQNQEHIRKIEELLSEIVDFKRVVVNEIRRHYSNAFFFRIARPYLVIFAILFLMIVFLPDPFATSSGFILPVVGIGALVLVTGFISGYADTIRKMAVKNQVMRFYKKSNVLLGPLGIRDFKYLKNIWECSNTDLKYEAKHLEKIKKQILSMDRRQFIKNPDVDLSFFSYLAGTRPDGLDDY